MRKKVDIDNWDRKLSFDTFSNYDDPYTGIITRINITNILEIAKNKDISFYGIMVYMLLKTMNEIEEFKYGYGKENDVYNVYYYENIAATMTVLKSNKELNFTRYVKYNSDFDQFIEEFDRAKNDAINGIDYFKIDGLTDCNKINVTCMPWVSFSSFKDAINYSEKNSKPKVCWGKYYNIEDQFYIDFSLLVNHAFQDGYQIGCLINNLQKTIDEFSIKSVKVLKR